MSNNWKDAPADIRRLQDDLFRTQRFFSETNEGISALYAAGQIPIPHKESKESHASWRELELLLDEGAEVLQKIEQFVDKLIGKESHGPGSSSGSGSGSGSQEMGKRRRILWLTGTTKVNKLRAELKTVTSHVCRLLIAQNV